MQWQPDLFHMVIIKLSVVFKFINYESNHDEIWILTIVTHTTKNTIYQQYLPKITTSNETTTATIKQQE